MKAKLFKNDQIFTNLGKQCDVCREQAANLYPISVTAHSISLIRDFNEMMRGERRINYQRRDMRATNLITLHV